MGKTVKFWSQLQDLEILEYTNGWSTFLKLAHPPLEQLCCRIKSRKPITTWKVALRNEMTILDSHRFHLFCKSRKTLTNRLLLWSRLQANRLTDASSSMFYNFLPLNTLINTWHIHEKLISCIVVATFLLVNQGFFYEELIYSQKFE